jgi:hypothetical protein
LGTAVSGGAGYAGPAGIVVAVGLIYIDAEIVQRLRHITYAADFVDHGSHFPSVSKPAGRSMPAVGMAHGTMSLILREWTDREAAVQHAREGVTLARQWGQADTLHFAYSCLANALQASGDLSEALDIVHKSKQIASGVSSWFAKYRRLESAQIAGGDVEAVRRWVRRETCASTMISASGDVHCIARWPGADHTGRIGRS